MHVTLLTIWTMRAFKEDAVAAEDFKRVAHCVRNPQSNFMQRICAHLPLPETAGSRVCVEWVSLRRCLRCTQQ